MESLKGIMFIMILGLFVSNIKPLNYNWYYVTTVNIISDKSYIHIDYLFGKKLGKKEYCIAG